MVDNERMLEPMNRPAMMMPIVKRFMIIPRRDNGASEPITSMFIFN